MGIAKKRLRVCLICVVFLAIIIGLFYIYYDKKQVELAGEGTLITITIMGMDNVCQ